LISIALDGILRIAAEEVASVARQNSRDWRARNPMRVDPRNQARSQRPPAPARGELSAFFEAVRARTTELCEGLSPEDCAGQSMTDASPIKWHLAHTSWFFETFVLAPSVAGYRAYHPEFSYLFNSYYNAVGERVARSQRGQITRPSLGEVMRYREHIDRHVSDLLGTARDLDCGVLELGCNHEQQHQELMLTDLKHLLWLNPLRPVYREQVESPALSSELAFRQHDEGVHWIGHEGDGFAFDNESPRHRVLVGAFEIASRPATNGEYLEFMADGGYERPELWLSDGWDAVASRRWRAPLYWESDGERWRSFTLSGMRGIDPHEPVCHVSYYEADAFARWANARLPRETEWEVAARALGIGEDCDSADDSASARSRSIDGHFAESGRFHPRATRGVKSSSEAARARVLLPQAMFGDVWEWTQSAYCAYPGYRPAEGALGEYNGKFMCNQMVLRGGSCASPRSHLRATYRNFFPPDARWQFSGIRLARDA
jgi:ergothioneine biosynthesis protein EgtB